MDQAVFGATLFGGSARLVGVETLLGRGLQRTILVGMADAVAREARERLPAALASHGYEYPHGKTLFNLIPAQLPKSGLPLDLALAVSLLQAQGHLRAWSGRTLFLAELDLAGRLRPPARGTLLATMCALRKGIRQVITAPEAVEEAAMAPGIAAFALRDLGAVIDFLQGHQECNAQPRPQPPPAAAHGVELRLDDVRGQTQARKAAVLCATGRHPLLLQGPPGTGKSLLARRIPALLPPLDETTTLELAQIEAQLGPVHPHGLRPPLRAPHPTVSAQGMLGGGAPLRPGEIARAHGGVLFLDELPEFARPVLEGLRQPLEEGEVRLQRAREWARFPARVLLVATRNPCPCGFATHPTVPCQCTPARLSAYQLRTSGPLLDRFDLLVEMGPVAAEQLQGEPTPPHDEEVRAQMEVARARQRRRIAQASCGPAGDASLEQLRQLGVNPNAAAALHLAAERLSLSGRGTLRALRVARTLADLDDSDSIQRTHLLQALSIRLSLAGAGPAPGAATS